MKCLEGVIHIIIGVTFLFFRVVSYVNVDNFIKISNNMFDYEKYTMGEITILQFSILPYLLGVLFITLGVIKLREVIVDG